MTKTPPPEEVVIERANPDDFDGVAKLVLASYRATLGEALDEGYATYLADVAHRADNAVLLVARDAGVLVGTVTYVPDSHSPLSEKMTEDEAGMRVLAVDPANQGNGYGRQLALACIERAREERKGGLFLYTTQLMRTAQAMYSSLGFQRVPARDWQVTPEVFLLAFRHALT